MNIKNTIVDFIEVYKRKELRTKLFLGFACGIPFLLRLSILDMWLKDCGVSNTDIGLISLIQWPYNLRFLWSPFIEKFNFPILSKLFGKRRGWALASQIMLFIGLLGMSCSSPTTSLCSLLLFTSLVAFGDGCQDTALYIYQISKTDAEMYGPTAGTCVLGYRLGLLFTKSVTLYLAYWLSWSSAYLVMALSIFICTYFIFKIPEPEGYYANQPEDALNPVNTMGNAIKQCLIEPFQLFMKRTHWRSILAVLLLFRVGDSLAQKMSRPLYMDLGFSILEIVNVVQVFGSVATLLGSIVGGYFIRKRGILQAMIDLGILHAVMCFFYVAVSIVGHNIHMLYVSVFFENVTSGGVVTAFLAFLYSLCNKKYAATQYALLWSLYGISSMLYRSVSGCIVDTIGWTNFFTIVPFTFVPGLIVLLSLKSKGFAEELSHPVRKG